MLIDLKNVKISASLSEETLAFTATLHIDGKPAYDVSNRGCGGCNNYYAKGKDVPSVKEIEAAIVAAGDAKADDFEILDGFIDDILAKVEAKKILDRYLRTRMVVIVQDKGKDALATYPTKYKPTPANIASLAAQLAKKNDGSVIVNNAPAAYDRALALV